MAAGTLRIAFAVLMMISTSLIAAALLARHWPGSEQRWTLEPPEPRPLLLRALRNGSEATSFARVVGWTASASPACRWRGCSAIRFRHKVAGQ